MKFQNCLGLKGTVPQNNVICQSGYNGDIDVGNKGC